MAGPGIRAWEMARALGNRNIRVILASPFPSARKASNVSTHTFSWEAPETLLRLVQGADAILMTGPVLARTVHLLGTPIGKPIIVDLYDVAEIEQIMLSVSSDDRLLDTSPVLLNELHTYLLAGDHYICASERQLDYWLGGLMAAGRLSASTLGGSFSLDQLICIVPFGVPDESPRAHANVLKSVVPGIRREDKVVLWGGGIWDWTDPFTLIEALDIVLKNRDDVRLVFGALHHFDPRVVPPMGAATRFGDLCRKRGLLGRHVFFLDWYPYDQRSAYLLEADVGVSLHKQTLEGRYAVRAHHLDYLWTSLPCVLTEGDSLGALLGEAGLAQLVLPGDVDGVASALLAAIADGESRQDIHQRTSHYVDQLRWSAVVEPVVRFVQEPRLARDSSYARGQLRNLIPMRREWETLRAEHEALAEEVRVLRSRRAVRIADFVGRALRRH